MRLVCEKRTSIGARRAARKAKIHVRQENDKNLNFTSRASAMVFAVGAAEGEPCRAVCAAWWGMSVVAQSVLHACEEGGATRFKT